ncbi:hypothetical protein TNCV_240291 [Trichonephila clavipes]|nr:hypothetical protein TNCV_240291 [Trichonephila clavipes]
MRQIARDMGISDRLVRRIAKAKLGLKPYKLRKVQLLTEKKLIQPRRCRKFLRRAIPQLALNRTELWTHESIISAGMVYIKDKRLEVLIVENFCKCLRLCIAANGSHFETN